MEKPYAAFGALIARARKARGDRQEDVAEKLKALNLISTTNHFSRVERGEHLPPKSKRDAIVKALRLDPKEVAEALGQLPPDELDREDDDEPKHVDPWARVRMRPDYAALPSWAQQYWHARTQFLTGSRETDTVKEGRLVIELGQIAADVASGRITEATMPRDLLVAPTPPPVEEVPDQPLAKGARVRRVK